MPSNEPCNCDQALSLKKELKRQIQICTDWREKAVSLAVRTKELEVRLNSIKQLVT